jgi:HlyD family secretion protein
MIHRKAVREMSPGRTAIRWWAIRVLPVLLLVGVAFATLRLRHTPPSVPTAEVIRGEFVDYSQLRGEVKAAKSVVLTAPSNAGDLQIIKLSKNGSPVKKGDIVVQFDSTDVQRKLEQTRTELKQAEAEIERMRAQSKLTEEQDTTDVGKAKFDVERARLDASKQEILSAIDGEKSKLTLLDTEQKLTEVEQQLKSHGLGAKADVNSRIYKREKADFDVKRGEKNIASMVLRAPVDGMVTLLENWRAGNFGSAPEWREGDRAWPGASIVELPDLSTVQVSAPVDETERGRLKTGQTVKIRVDAVPDREFNGVLAEISPLTKPDFTIWPPTKNFNITIQLQASDARLRPGMSATARIAVAKVGDAVLVPAEAVFQRSGRTVVYVLRGSSFEERAVEISRRGNGQCAVESGLKPGEKVAIKDPVAEAKQGKS